MAPPLPQWMAVCQLAGCEVMLVFQSEYPCAGFVVTSMPSAWSCCDMRAAFSQ
jgi:hypothetical protein